MRLLSLLLLIPALQQSTPTGGAIAKFVPPVPTPASFISDERGVLTSDQRRALDARITTFQQTGLGDIAVAILPSIGSYSPNQVAVEIYRTWKVGSVAPVGSAHRNVGALLLIVPKELAPDGKGQCWINTGTGSEGIITDATAGSICRDSIIPHLRTRNYHAAIGAGIGAIESRMRLDAAIVSEPFRPVAAPSSQAADASGDGIPKAPFAIGGLIVLAIAAITGRRYMRNRPRKCPKCSSRMRRLGELADNSALDHGSLVEEKLGSVDYDVWVCECGGQRIIPYRRAFTKYKECRTCHHRTASGKRVVLSAATTDADGRAEDRYKCRACKATWVELVVLPQIVEASAGSSGSSSGFSGGGGGGGGGSSFGGSGSTAGGGGGSSY